tara:strand:+ start:689 stop:1873 length:1185 start_codon:yes stop_codon:yes gene_type:complete
MKRFFFIISILFLLFSLIIIFDLKYLTKGVSSTYMIGKTSANIYDHHLFETREVYKDSTYNIPISKLYSKYFGNIEVDEFLKNSKSNSFILIKNDSIHVENYWRGGGVDVLSNSFSIAKSIVSILIGCAIEDGFIENVDQSIVDFIPRISNFNDSKPIKIKHLLSMSSGYDWFENYKRPISVTAKAYYGENIDDLILSRKFIKDPGISFSYQSGDTQLLGYLLKKATNQNVSEYASKVLWGPMGATNNAAWTLDKKNGTEKVFCCFNSTARDFLKIGIMLKNDGKINNNQILSKGYINWLLTIPKLINNDKKSLFYKNRIEHYSNSWYLAKVLNKRVIYARGYLGQYIVIIPEIDVVFVRLGEKDFNNDGIFDNKYYLSDELSSLIEQVIIKYN